MNKVQIGALLENKLKKERIYDMMIKLFCGWDYYSSSILEGRILVLWQKSFTKVQVLMEQHQLVHYSVKIIGIQMEFLVTFVYGLNTLDERLEIWRGLSCIHVINKPWLIVGDFNAVFNFDDRVGGRTISAVEILDSNAWLAHSQLVSLKRIGSNFTWSNKQDGGDRVYSKIYHVFINEDWIDALPHSIAEFHWEAFSDHCYCLIKTLKLGSLGTKPFQFFNFWITHRGFKEVVLDSWNKPLVARGLLGVTKKLLRLKHILKAFNIEEIEDVEQGYHQAKGDYQLALTRAQAAPTDFAVQEAEKSAAVRYQHHADRYRSFLIQRSKITWLQKGYDNNAYFHACIKKRREENRIVSFLNERGVIIDDYEAVVHHFLDHFRGYMGSSSSTNGSFNSQCIEFGTCLDIEMQLWLTRDFGKSDVKKALLSISGIKSPGSDGFGSEFYKTRWLDIGDDISAAVLGFFRDGRIPAELNETALSLVPKTETPSRAVDYRSVACCNTLYKCI
ncbi:uncharacterized protein LOC133832581 [Humulus lupulus]|uniref:uncharacterized protein LOC133832581 n=1 Tax=Humulus lupulus TaxID=3486 RepID=UPI002B40EFE6|nr:uncharacterized protein LOC133832581 [Humulus lupulus]